MGYRLLADLILVLHFSFIIFALLGGLLSLHRKGWIWLHLPAIAWGVWIEWSGSVCPLTPLENRFRQIATGQGYHGSFIEHYLIPVLYPHGLSNTLQWFLGGALLVANAFVYLCVFYRRRKRRTQVDECPSCGNVSEKEGD